MEYICSECNSVYKIDSKRFLCNCGALLNIKEYKISLDHIDNSIAGLFRYKSALPFSKESKSFKDISMGEGMTPIVPLDSNNKNILLKLDYLMPTLSFKDRGASVLITKAKELGVKKVIQDSSGNAGTSIAAYASRGNIECEIFVPKNTSKAKINQIKFHNAKINIVDGSREDTAKAALDKAMTDHIFYASHVYNPLFYEGTKTYVYEIYEQLGSLPDKLFIPLGNGSLLLGVYYGLRDLLNLNLIDRLPKIIAVQSENCPPIYNAFIKNKASLEDFKSHDTLAEGIAIKKPLRYKEILKAIKNTDGSIILAREEKILDSQRYLAKKGFFVETTAAATMAAFTDYRNRGYLGEDEIVLIPLCGSGLKTIK